jgi:hypothetical protein
MASAILCVPDAAASTASPPDEVRQALFGNPILNGQARLRFLGLKVYDAKLWVRQGFEPERPMDHPLVLQLTYLRSLKGPLIAKRSLEEMQRPAPVDEQQADAWLSFMTSTFPDVTEGDRISGAWAPDKTESRFWFNGQPSGNLQDASFGRRFFGIWLASTTSEPAMRRELLGSGAKP